MFSGDVFRFLGFRASIAELQQLFWSAPSCVKVKSSHLLLPARCSFSFGKFPVQVSGEFGFSPDR